MSCSCLISFIISNAQTRVIVPQITPVNPAAASLFKVVEHPIGNFSGTVPVDFPIYSLEGRNVKLPITVSYHTGGIKVEEIAGPVGLGWSFSAGGNITRAVNGVEDDSGHGILSSVKKPQDYIYNMNGADAYAIAENVYDTQPDTYYYNINGRSGKFFFKDNGEVAQFQQTPLSFEPVFEEPAHKRYIKGWVVKDEEGRKYYLGTNRSGTTTMFETTSTSYLVNSGITIPASKYYRSGWNLLEIFDMNDRPIAQFTYRGVSTGYMVRSQESTPLQVTVSNECTSEEILGNKSIAYNETSGSLLHWIKTDFGSVEILASPKLDAGYKIDSLIVTDHKNNRKKKVNFTYEYFQAPNAPANSDPVFKRLKLKRITEFGSNDTDSLAYVFDYIEDVVLPSRLSYAYDYWGYYNGKNGNTTSIPGEEIDVSGLKLQYQYGGDRKVDFNFAKAHALRKISYPTGGYREFFYEGNTASMPRWSQAIREFDRFVKQAHETVTFSPFVNLQTPRYQKEIEVNSASGSASFTYSMILYTPNPGYYFFRIRKLDAPGGTGIVVDNFSDLLSGTTTLPNGYYRVEIYSYLPGTEFQSAKFNWIEDKTPTEIYGRYGEDFLKGDVRVGGIRVKELHDYDPVTDSIYKTKYEYKQNENPSLSSGLLISPLVLVHRGTCDQRFCQYYRLSSMSQYPLGNEGGSYVYYPEVRTIREGNGYTDSEYSFDFDLFSWQLDEIAAQHPVVPRIDNGWKRSKLLKEAVYNEQKQILSKKITLYPFLYPLEIGEGADDWSSINQKVQVGLRLARFARPDITTHVEWCWLDYKYYSHFSQPKSIIQTTYTPDGPIELKTDMSYYINLDRPLLKEKKDYLNNEKIMETEFRYTFNADSTFVFPIELSMKQNLLTKHYLLPLESVTYIKEGTNRNFNKGSRTSFGTYNGHFIEKSTQRQYFSLFDYDELNFSSYDTLGNITEMYKTNDIKYTFVWGNGNRYPLAKVLGSDYQSVAQILDLQLLNNNASTDLQIRQELKKLRDQLGSAMVYSFTYDPLFGVSSTVEPNGQVSFFEYDTFGRLKLVRDLNNRIIKQYDYKYQQSN